MPSDVLLAIETSTRLGSVAILSADGALLAAESLGSARDQGNRLAPTVQRLLAGRIHEVETYALSIGPGSFTGLRIGLAFLKGLAMVVPRPTHAISTLEVLAAGIVERHPEATHVLALINAQRGEVYAQAFVRSGETLAADDRVPPGLYPISVVVERMGSDARIVAGGDGLTVEMPAVKWTRADTAVWNPVASTLGRLAWRRKDQIGADPLSLEPTYLQLSTPERLRASSVTGASSRGESVTDPTPSR